MTAWDWLQESPPVDTQTIRARQALGGWLPGKKDAAREGKKGGRSPRITSVPASLADLDESLQDRYYGYAAEHAALGIAEAWLQAFWPSRARTVDEATLASDARAFYRSLLGDGGERSLGRETRRLLEAYGVEGAPLPDLHTEDLLMGAMAALLEASFGVGLLCIDLVRGRCFGSTDADLPLLWVYRRRGGGLIVQLHTHGDLTKTFRSLRDAGEPWEKSVDEWRRNARDALASLDALRRRKATDLKAQFPEWSSEKKDVLCRLWYEKEEAHPPPATPGSA